MVKRFDFLPDQTAGDPHTDTVILPNIPLFAAGASMKDASSMTLWGFESALKTMSKEDSTRLFLKRTVQEALWGYECELTAMASMMLRAQVSSILCVDILRVEPAVSWCLFCIQDASV